MSRRLHANNKILSQYQNHQRKKGSGITRSARRIVQNMETSNPKFAEDVLKPTKIQKGSKTQQEVMNAYKMRERERNEEAKKFVNKNTPYKVIFKDRKNDFRPRKPEEMKKEELIVHTVTEEDKDVEEVERKLDELESKKKRIDDENKQIFSREKKAEHDKNFEHQQALKTYSIQDDTSTHDDLRDVGLDFLKKQQKDADVGKKKLDEFKKFLDASSNSKTKSSNGPKKEIVI